MSHRFRLPAILGLVEDVADFEAKDMSLYKQTLFF